MDQTDRKMPTKKTTAKPGVKRKRKFPAITFDSGRIGVKRPKSGVKRKRKFPAITFDSGRIGVKLQRPAVVRTFPPLLKGKVDFGTIAYGPDSGGERAANCSE